MNYSVTDQDSVQGMKVSIPTITFNDEGSVKPELICHIMARRNWAEDES